MQPVLEINHLVKHYGAVRALDGVSFSVPPGSVFGILGPNGSGKTTLLGVIMEVLKPTSGTFSLMGKGPDPDVRKGIGTLLETPNFYHYLSAERNLRIAAAIKGCPESRIPEVLRQVGLYERRGSKFSTFSLGMKQRLAIASTLLADPSVLLFDEPTNGLDPVGIAEIRDLIRSLHASGKTIIMASHLLDEVEKVCTHVAILQKGKLLTSGPVDEVLLNEDIVEVEGGAPEALEAALQNLAGLTSIKRSGSKVLLYFPQGTAQPESINAACFAQGITLSCLNKKKKSLEAKFFELTEQVGSRQ